MTGHVEDAVACFHQMCNELAQKIDGERANWTQGKGRHEHFKGCLCDYPLSDFQSRCRRKIEDLGDIAMNAREYDRAILQYTSALSLEPATPHDLLVKRSKARVGKGLWEDALNDANEVGYFRLIRVL